MTMKTHLMAFAVALGLCAAQPAWAQTGTVTIVKVATPKDAQDFAFTVSGNGGAVGGAQLDDDAGAAGANGYLATSKSFGLAQGIYVFKETPMPAGWTLSSIACTGPAGNHSVSLPSREVKVKVNAGAAITCTFTNVKTAPAAGTVTVKKIIVPPTDPGRFTLQLTPAGGTLLANFLNAGNGATMGPVTVPAGNYIVSEAGGSNPSTSLSNYTAVISGAGCAANGAVTVTAGVNRVCTITNTRNPTTCTGWPMQATVSIYNPMTPFGPQTVDICRGGTVKFNNVNSGVPWNIQYFSGPSAFPSVPLATSPSTGTTAVLSAPGAYDYVIGGVGGPSFVVHGHINVH
ncbi:MAG: hypothetical protein ABW360_06405 [Phenylobacterium sp.]